VDGLRPIVNATFAGMIYVQIAPNIPRLLCLE
jgi:hypothetical protein